MLIVPSTGVTVMLVILMITGSNVSIDKLVVNAVNPLQPEIHVILERQFFQYIEVTRSAAEKIKN
jgi:hypothetical protein